MARCHSPSFVLFVLLELDLPHAFAQTFEEHVDFLLPVSCRGKVVDPLLVNLKLIDVLLRLVSSPGFSVVIDTVPFDTDDDTASVLDRLQFVGETNIGDQDDVSRRTNDIISSLVEQSVDRLVRLFLTSSLDINKLLDTDELYEYVLDVASGKKVKSEEDGFRDLAIFKQGVTL